jgi:hypothetical protein
MTDPVTDGDVLARLDYMSDQRHVATIANWHQLARDAAAEVRALREHGTPGVMHEVDRAFYDLTVKERNLERARVDRLEAEVRALRSVVDAVRQWGPHTPRRVTRALQALAATDRPPTWRAGHGPEPPTGTCICPRFKDTGGFRIADLACPVHGVDGTDPGDGYWACTCPGGGGPDGYEHRPGCPRNPDRMMQSVWPKKAGVDTVDLADSDDGTPDTDQQQREEDT